ncbi:molybdopterin-guanine dinucleotide biosynthesis protein B [candidate division KSB1 bacterium]|nr:molybdopterin-guanine dinucleotide biosynthesis protein B [candidate division KSB1 bacterium]
MITFQVCGRSNSGKTETVTNVISQLVKAGHHVASVKSIHFEEFKIDQPGKDTFLHRQAGANPVVAAGLSETDYLYDQRQGFIEIAAKISADWLVVEGFNNFSLPKIACGKNKDELDQFIDRRTFAIAGIIAKEMTEYRGLPVFDVRDHQQLEKLMDLIKQKTFPLLPYVEEDCCQLCGMSCQQLVEAIVQGEKKFEDCIVKKSTINLRLDDQEIVMVPFVQRILRNTILGIASELRGWEKGKKIDIELHL